MTTKLSKYRDAEDRIESRADAACDAKCRASTAKLAPPKHNWIMLQHADGTYLDDADVATKYTRLAVALHRSLADGTYRADEHKLSEILRKHSIQTIRDAYPDEDPDELARADNAYLVSMAASAARKIASGASTPTPKADAAPTTTKTSSRATSKARTAEQTARAKMIADSDQAWSRPTTNTDDSEDE